MNNNGIFPSFASEAEWDASGMIADQLGCKDPLELAQKLSGSYGCSTMADAGVMSREDVAAMLAESIVRRSIDIQLAETYNEMASERDLIQLDPYSGDIKRLWDADDVIQCMTDDPVAVLDSIVEEEGIKELSDHSSIEHDKTAAQIAAAIQACSELSTERMLEHFDRMGIPMRDGEDR